MYKTLRKLNCGASLTEFVIVGPIAILFTFVILQSGLLYMAKLQLNNATFMAARYGATQNANINDIRISLIKGLIPFYQNAFTTNDVSRLTDAAVKAAIDNPPLPPPLSNLDLVVLSPSSEAFQKYGIQKNGVTYIPNDNLEFRNPAPMNGATISIRDANILRIKVTYGYELKVPLMRAIFSRIMCLGARSDVAAWDRSNLLPFGDINDCARYYSRGRIPIVSFATVQMQSDPRQ
jgi:TadE-like protein